MTADIAIGFVAKLAADTGVQGAIGARVYPSYDRQADRTYPLAVYDLNVSPVNAFDGPTGMMTATLEIAAIARTYAETVTVANAIRAALEYQAGPWVDGAGGGARVQGCFLQDDGERDDKVTDPTSEQILFYVKALRFDIVFDATL